MENRNEYICKRNRTKVERFSRDLEAFRQMTGEDEATLYEDQYTSFTLSNVRLEDGKLCYTYDGQDEQDEILNWDEDEKEWYEPSWDEITDTITYWRESLRRAKRYWASDSEWLDRIQDPTSGVMDCE